MQRREFVRLATLPILGGFGLSIAGCGVGPAKNPALAMPMMRSNSLKIWSYYVPLTSYSGIMEEFDGRHEYDRKIIFDEVRRRTNRISGRRSDGTLNRADLDLDALRETDDMLRVAFWHDDQDSDGDTGHSLFVFPRYLADLDAGETVFLATGMYQSHFHVVMIEPATWSLHP